MADQNIMKRLFNLYLIFVKVNDVRDKVTLKNEIDLLYQEVIKHDTISGEEKSVFNEILKLYKIIYESNDIVQAYEAEERVRKIIEDVKEDRKLTFLSPDLKAIREYEQREKALADYRNFMHGAMEEGRKEVMVMAVKSLLESGMPISEVAQHTSYSEPELKELLKDF